MNFMLIRRGQLTVLNDTKHKWGCLSVTEKRTVLRTFQTPLVEAQTFWYMPVLFSGVPGCPGIP